MLFCAILLILHLVSMFTLISQVVIILHNSTQPSLLTGETSALVAVAVFDDNVTEEGDNFIAVLNISEYSEFLGVILSRNGSTASAV